MNKKRISLILASMIGLNGLVVTFVGNNGHQNIVAYASERLTNPDDIKKLTGINIETLNITVENITDSDVNLTFSGLTKDNVDDVKGTLSYTKFVERTGDINNSVNVVWDKQTGKASVKGMNAPGIYSGDITIKFKSGDTRTYTITLRKNYEQGVLTLTPEVGIGTIGVKDIKVDGQPKTLNNNNVLELYFDGKILGTINDTNSKFSVPGMKLGQTYKLVYKENGQVVAETQFVLTKQAQATVKAYATNTKDGASTIKKAIETDYGVQSANVNITSTPNTSTYLENATFDFKVGNTSVLSYEQTQTIASDGNGHRQGGAKIDVLSTPTTQSNLTIIVGGDNVNLVNLDQVNGNNFLPSHWITWGPIRGTITSANVGKQMNVAYGTGSVTLGNETKELYDASKELKQNNVFPGKIRINNILYNNLCVIGGVKPKEEIDDLLPPGTAQPDTNTGVIDANNLSTSTVSFTYDTKGLEHGYTSVSLDFTAKESSILGSTVEEIAQIVIDSATSTVNKAILPKKSGTNNTDTFKFNTKHTTDPVKASIVIGKDALDGKLFDVKFERTSSLEGKLIFTNGNELLEGTDTNTLARNLTVNGSNAGVSFLEQTSNGDLVFGVKFDKEIPSTIIWKLNGLESTINVVGVDAVNFDGQVSVSNKNTDKIQNKFEVVAKFNSTVPTGGSLKFDNLSDMIVDFSNVSNGAHKISTTIDKGKYQGTYSAGVWITKQPMGVKVDAKSTVNNRIDVTVDAEFFNKDDVQKATAAKLVYIKVGNSSSNPVEITIAKEQIKEDPINLTLTVDAGKYDVKAVYTFDGKEIVSNVVQVEVKGSTNTGNNNGSEIVSGGSGSTTTPGNSVGSTTIVVTSNNSASNSDTVNVNIQNIKYDSRKNPVIVKMTYRDKDGKTVTETKEQYSNVSAKFENGKVVVDGLVPGKDYSEISIDYTDIDGRTRTLILKDVKTTATTDLEKYLADVYTIVFKRPADEAGYHFHLNNLKDKKVSLRGFLKNMLNEKEFNENYKTPETKVEALYAAIVARTPDQAGKDFWVNEYKKAVTSYGSEALALQAIVDRMVNEPELKTLAEKMNVQW